MLDFLDRAQDSRSGSTLAAADRDLVFGAEIALRAAYANANLDLRNIESLWSTLQMAELLGGCPGISPADLPRCDLALRRLIVDTLSSSLKPRYTNSDDAGLVFPYDEFRKSVLYDLNPYALITFNYDVALDITMAPDKWERSPRNVPAVPDRILNIDSSPVIKLHGSVNWVRCVKCGLIVECGWTDSAWVALKVGQNLSGRICPQCKGACSPDPVIVPPTWTKMEDQRQISGVWQRAAKELRGVRNLFIIGYSLPTSDRFFRDLFGIATIGAPLRRICIIDPAAEAVGARWREFIGPGALPYLKLWPKKFSEAIGDMRRVLKDDDSYG